MSSEGGMGTCCGRPPHRCEAGAISGFPQVVRYGVGPRYTLADPFRLATPRPISSASIMTQ
jgi:hypothetical protein